MGKQIGIIYRCTCDCVADWFDDEDLCDLFELQIINNGYMMSAVVPSQFSDYDSVFDEDYLDEVREDVDELGLSGVDLLNKIASLTRTKYLPISSNKYIFYKRCSKAKAILYYSVVNEQYYSQYTTYFVIAEVNDSLSKYELSMIRLNPEDGVQDYDVDWGEVDVESAPFICDTADWNPDLGDFFVDYAYSNGGIAKFLRELYPGEDIPRTIIDLR